MKKQFLILYFLGIILVSCSCAQVCCPRIVKQDFGTSSDLPAHSNERLQSDIQIIKSQTSVKDLGEYYYLDLEATTKNDDDARDVELIINLPVENEFVSIGGGSVLIKEVNAQGKETGKRILKERVICKQCGHVVKCWPESKDLAKNNIMTFEAKIGKSRFDNVVETIGATIISHYPSDPNPSNNTWFWREQ